MGPEIVAIFILASHMQCFPLNLFLKWLQRLFQVKHNFIVLMLPVSLFTSVFTVQAKYRVRQTNEGMNTFNLTILTTLTVYYVMMTFGDVCDLLFFKSTKRLWKVSKFFLNFSSSKFGNLFQRKKATTKGKTGDNLETINRIHK